MSRFSDEELRRYGRQMLLREVGGRGQERLRAAEVTLSAVGQAGAVAAEYLTRAGVPLRLRAAPRGPSLLTMAGPEAGGDGGPDSAASCMIPGGPRLFAASEGPLGEVGAGCPCGADALLREASGDGAAAFATGSLLALEAIKSLLLLPEALEGGGAISPLRADRVLRIDLGADHGPGITARAAHACLCRPATPPLGSHSAS